MVVVLVTKLEIEKWAQLDLTHGCGRICGSSSGTGFFSGSSCCTFVTFANNNSFCQWHGKVFTIPSTAFELQYYTEKVLAQIFCQYTYV